MMKINNDGRQLRMKNTTLKKSNLKVSVIGLGTNAVGGHNLFQNLNEEDGKDFVRAAINTWR